MVGLAAPPWMGGVMADIQQLHGRNKPENVASKRRG
jgi:hypothetical protein